MDCPNYGCGEDWEDYVPLACTSFNGGASAILLLRCGITLTDPSDETEIQTLIDDGDAKLLTGLRIDIPAGSAVTADTFVACQTEATVTYDRTINVADRNVTPENVIFYNSIDSANGFNIGGALVYECDADRVSYVDAVLKKSGGRIMPAGNNELQRFEYVLAFRSKDDPLIYTKPVGIFG
jgi:hypothetical protein